VSDEVFDLAEYRLQKSLRQHDWTAISQQFQAEEDHAAALCDEILTGPSVWWPRRLHKAGSAALTVAVARTLGRRMAERIESEPADALVLSSMAMDVATRLLASARYSDSILLKCYTDSLRDHAYLLSCLGRCEEGIDFVAAAELWREHPAFYDEEGLNALVKAVLLRKLSRHHAAARCTTRARPTGPWPSGPVWRTAARPGGPTNSASRRTSRRASTRPRTPRRACCSMRPARTRGRSGWSGSLRRRRSVTADLSSHW
jgi:anti-sigma-K factor RskA